MQIRSFLFQCLFAILALQQKISLQPKLHYFKTTKQQQTNKEENVPQTTPMRKVLAARLVFCSFKNVIPECNQPYQHAFATSSFQHKLQLHRTDIDTKSAFRREFRANKKSVSKWQFIHKWRADEWWEIMTRNYEKQWVMNNEGKKTHKNIISLMLIMLLKMTLINKKIILNTSTCKNSNNTSK